MATGAGYLTVPPGPRVLHPELLCIVRGGWGKPRSHWTRPASYVCGTGFVNGKLQKWVREACASTNNTETQRMSLLLHGSCMLFTPQFVHS